MVKKSYWGTDKNKKYWNIPVWTIALLIMLISGTMLVVSLIHDDDPNSDLYSYRIINPDDVVKFIEQGAVIVDCNPPEMYNQSHIPEAINLPIIYNETCVECWGSRLQNFTNRTDIIIFYDNSGVRSEQGWLFCQHMKYPYEAHILRGGLARWKAEGYPINEE